MRKLTALLSCAALLLAQPAQARGDLLGLLGSGGKITVAAAGGSVPVIASSTATSSTPVGGSVTCVTNKPTGTVAGDTLVFFYLGISTASPTTVGNQAGATKVRSRTDLSATFYYQIAAYTLTATGSEGATFSFTETATGPVGCSLSASRITGANATPVDVSADSLDTSATTTPAAAGVTTVASNDLIVVYAQGASVTANGASGWATTASTGFTIATGSVINDTSDSWNFGIEGKSQVSPGATGNFTVPYPGTVNTIFQAITLAIKP